MEKRDLFVQFVFEMCRFTVLRNLLHFCHKCIAKYFGKKKQIITIIRLRQLQCTRLLIPLLLSKGRR